MNQFKLAFVFLLSVSAINFVSATPGEGSKLSGRWGAIAFSANAIRWGKAVSESSEYVAKETAIRGCASSDCEIKSYVYDGCLAVAVGFENGNQPREWYGFAGAIPKSDREEDLDDARIRAGEAAKVACDAASKSHSCYVTQKFCTWDKAEASSDAKIREWIREFGGEQAEGLRKMVYTVNIMNQNYLLRMGLDFKRSACLAGTKWPSVYRFATKCKLSTEDLDAMYGFLN